MTYAPPSGDAVNFEMASGYMPPGGDAVDFQLLSGPALPTPSLVPGLLVSVGLPYHNQSQARLDAGAALPYKLPLPQEQSTALPWWRLNDRDCALISPWGTLSKLDHSTAAGWGFAACTDAGRLMRWRLVQAKDIDTTAPWGQATARNNGDAIRYRQLVTPGRRNQAQDVADAMLWRSVDIFRNRWPNEPRPYVVPPATAVNFEMDSGYTPPVGDAVDFDLSIWANDTRGRPVRPLDRGPSLDYRQLITRLGQSKDSSLWLRWGPGGPGWYRDPPPTSLPWPVEQNDTTEPEPPLLLEAYTTMASIDIVTLPDRTPVLCNEVSVRTDRSSWCWQIDFSPARKEDLALVMPTGATPVEIEITINGYVWTAICEGYTRDCKHSSSDYRVTGRSRTALLAAPYAPALVYSQASARNVSQLVADELTDTGYTSTYNAVDWLVPGGVWNYSGLTKMAAIQRLAEASGARVVSDREALVIRIEPAHINPWDDWVGTAADVTLHEMLITSHGVQWAPAPAYNACYVVGQTQGVIVNAIRTGSAGDKPAPQIVEALSTAVEGGRERGRAVIAKSGNWESATTSLPLLTGTGLPGLVEPGALVEVTEGGETFKALCSSTQITGTRRSATSIRQTIKLERYRGS